MTKRLIISLFALCSLFNPLCFASRGNQREGTETGNGGNQIALEFLDAARISIDLFSQGLANSPKLSVKALKTLLTKVSVIATTDPLSADLKGFKQEVTALNFIDSQLIIINESRWNSMSGPIREALALHELLGLLGIEKTGDYHISRGYLEILGIRCDHELCEVGPHVLEEVPHDPICRLNSRKYPDDRGRFEFNCTGKTADFPVHCDLRTDPVENGGYTKLDIRAGRWVIQSNGEFLKFDDGFTSGILACEKVF